MGRTAGLLSVTAEYADFVAEPALSALSFLSADDGSSAGHSYILHRSLANNRKYT